MSQAVLQGDPPITVELRQSARARRITLRVSRLDGRVTLTRPRGVRASEALAFARAREGWIRKQLSAQPSATLVDIGSVVPVLGQPRRIVAGKGRSVVLSETELAVPGASVGRKVQAWLKQMARAELSFAADAYAGQLGLRYSKLTLRDTRSRWGSCTSAGGLMFSWRLIMAPAEVLSYVAAHEVAHLREMNHSRAFWQVVEDLYGDHRDARTWLRREGHALHAYQFEAPRPEL